MQNKVAIVTGASGGIGLATATLFSEKGYTVYGLSRKPYESGAVIHIPTDVTDPESVRQAIATITEREGRIDVLICNAGFGISGAVEFTEPPDAKRQFDVNFFGMVNMNKAVIPVMRQNGCGRLRFLFKDRRLRFPSHHLLCHGTHNIYQPEFRCQKI